MMSAVNDLFNEYTSLRINGLGVSTTLGTLRPFINMLAKIQKQELSAMLKGWEENIQNNDNDNSAFDVFEVDATTILPEHRSTVTEWIACINCSEKNRKTSIFCHNCGTILDEDDEEGDTQFFTDRFDTKADYFGQDSVLVLFIPDTDIEYEIRPQSKADRVYVGRMDSTNTIVPDVDLASAEGGSMGVSRLHLSIKYDATENILKIFDLGSINGTFLNEQRVHPKEVRILCNGDSLRLGKLRLKVNFYHPGDEI